MTYPSPLSTYPGDIHPGDIYPDYSVATVYNCGGQPHDYVAGHAAALSYAACGYRVKVHSGDAPTATKSYRKPSIRN